MRSSAEKPRPVITLMPIDSKNSRLTRCARATCGCSGSTSAPWTPTYRTPSRSIPNGSVAVVATLVTPGIARSRSSMPARHDNTRSATIACVAPPPCGGKMRDGGSCASNTSRPRGSNPRLASPRLAKLRTSQPAPATRVIASAISTTIIDFNGRWVRPPAVALRPLSFMSVRRLVRANRSAGASPTRTAVTMSTTTRNTSIRVSNGTVSRRGSCGRAQCQQRAHSAERERYSCQRARGGDDERFRHQLPHDPAAARPEGDAHGNFAGPHRAAGQHQVRHVHARQQQQQRGGAEHDDQRRAEIANHCGDERTNHITPILAEIAVVVRDAGHRGRHLALEPLEPHAGLDAQIPVEAMTG